MFNATFFSPDLTTFTGLDALGLKVTGQNITPTCKDLYCQVASPDRYCHRSGAAATVHDVTVRHLAHAPMGSIPVKLHVAVRRYSCATCHHVFRDDTRRAASPRQKLSRGGLAWGLHAVIVDKMSISRIAATLGVSWGTANAAILMEGLTRLVNDPHRFDGVKVIGVDEHVWRHTRRGDHFVTVIIDLTPVREGTGPSRLLDMVRRPFQERVQNLAGPPQ